MFLKLVRRDDAHHIIRGAGDRGRCHVRRRGRVVCVKRVDGGRGRGRLAVHRSDGRGYGRHLIPRAIGVIPELLCTDRRIS